MRVTTTDVMAMYQRGERIGMVTAYDFCSARLVDRSSLPMILVGDSMGMVVQGHASTIPVTLDDIVYHTRAVIRGCRRPLVVADLPFLTYTTPEEALRNAGRLMAEGGAQAVKLEGGVAFAPTIRRIVEAGIPVMGHIGFTPQSVHQIGLKVQGKDVANARRLLEDALAIQEAGAFGMVLELMPAPLATAITQRLQIPTIGIGAGPGCSGEVQVWHDILGLYDEFLPRHTRRFATLTENILTALEEYAEGVRSGTFPTSENAASLAPEILAEAFGKLSDAAPAEGGPSGTSVGGAQAEGRPVAGTEGP